MSETRAAVVLGADGLPRCSWSASDDEYRRYHDEEWGIQLHGDQALFEKLSLEGFQAGLSWITILRRRPAFRAAFHGFDIEDVAEFTPREVDGLMLDARIIRNRAKIEATISNAVIVRDLVRDDPDVGLRTGARFPITADRLRRRPGGDAGIDRDEQALALTRPPLRRADDALRPHAVIRHGR
jgi:hypothetical protein